VSGLRAGYSHVYDNAHRADLWSDNGHKICDVFAATGMELVRQSLERLCEDDLAKQLWFIRASLATLPKITHRCVHAMVSPASLHLDDLLAQAKPLPIVST
jgi:hypothetical protein